MTLDWRTAFGYMFRDAHWKRKLLVGGLWILLLPPVGWLIALGYRKQALLALVEDSSAALPSWTGHTRRFLIDGVKAAAVILVYFAPFLAAFMVSAVGDVSAARAHAVELAVLGLGVLLLLPVCLPLLPPLYWYLFDWVSLSWPQAFALGALFWGTMFLVPAAFLQVSLHSRFRAAFRIDRVLIFCAGNLRTYLEAWALSVVATALALALVPAAPWGIFWSYLVIVHAFNEALFRSATPLVRHRFRNSAFARSEAPALTPRDGSPTATPRGEGRRRRTDPAPRTGTRRPP